MTIWEGGGGPTDPESNWEDQHFAIREWADFVYLIMKLVP
jgi:hypothetical protein